LFADLRGRRVLLVGGGEVAERKARLLFEAGARVEIVAREIVAPELASWINPTLPLPRPAGEGRGESVAAGSVNWLAREFDASQLEGATLVVAGSMTIALAQSTKGVAPLNPNTSREETRHEESRDPV